ncbi:hypothetical protein BXZ70DRAFT_440315 [Cristinia sonorae]|uniref:Uncharacterized protein n=1 Tax=Cristinia sonorae TaxID=1940300 RepID=A0A8K0UKB4_9AGAR|nr:hypothetical protein BXZ70DRAFT_440315 [Cristinia sonorae]
MDAIEKVSLFLAQCHVWLLIAQHPQCSDERLVLKSSLPRQHHDVKVSENSLRPLDGIAENVSTGSNGNRLAPKHLVKKPARQIFSRISATSSSAILRRPVESWSKLVQRRGYAAGDTLDTLEVNEPLMDGSWKKVERSVKGMSWRKKPLSTSVPSVAFPSLQCQISELGLIEALPGETSEGEVEGSDDITSNNPFSHFPHPSSPAENPCDPGQLETSSGDCSQSVSVMNLCGPSCKDTRDLNNLNAVIYSFCVAGIIFIFSFTLTVLTQSLL